MPVACGRGDKLFGVELSSGLEAGDQDIKITPAAPQHADTRPAIVGSTEVTAETSDPLDSLFDSWWFGRRRRQALLKPRVQRLPFHFA